jgi:prepilin-type N-terminal cleavage/methylation domain-containing protein
MPTLPQRSTRFHRRCAGFTIVEVLTVVAILGILAALLLPVLGRTQQNAKKAKTRVQFSQWSSAIEAFRQEYGHYPVFHTSGNAAFIENGRIDNATRTNIFAQALSGTTLAGARYSDTDPGFVAGNVKRIRFYSFGEPDLTKDASPLLQDAFGNTEVVVLMDKNYDGQIRFGSSANDDYASPPSVGGLTVSSTDPIRAGVAIYSAGAGNSAGDIVTSWAP